MFRTLIAIFALAEIVAAVAAVFAIGHLFPTMDSTLRANLQFTAFWVVNIPAAYFGESF